MAGGGRVALDSTPEDDHRRAIDVKVVDHDIAMSRANSRRQDRGQWMYFAVVMPMVIYIPVTFHFGDVSVWITAELIISVVSLSAVGAILSSGRRKK